MKKKDDLVSVIVPVYNIADYLERCLNSIINQTYKEIEILLIDDGSTDGSGIICDRYKTNDNRISVIHKENGGLSDARNVGMHIAKGDYITFVDGDDYISENYIDHMIQGAYMVDADIAVIGILDVFSDKDIKSDLEKNSAKYLKLTDEDCLEHVLYQKNMDLHSCGKLYRRELLNDLSFPKGKLYEDWLFTPFAIGLSNKVVVIDEVGYYYVQRHGSLSNGGFSYSCMDAIDNAQILMKYVARNYPGLTKAAYSRYLSILFAIFMKVNDDRYAEVKNYLWNEIKSIRSIVLFDPKSSKKSKIAALISYLGKGIFSVVYKCTRKRARMNARCS